MSEWQHTLEMLGIGTRSSEAAEQASALMKAALVAGGDPQLTRSIMPKFAGRLQNVGTGVPAALPALPAISPDAIAKMGAAGVGDLVPWLTAFAERYNDDFMKSITTTTGLVAYDLQRPAKNLYPFYTPIRNVMPRVGGGVGLATNWRVVSAIIGSGVPTMGWVPEGQRSGRMSYTTANRSANYVSIGEEDSATFEAISAVFGASSVTLIEAGPEVTPLIVRVTPGIASVRTLVADSPSTPSIV